MKSNVTITSGNTGLLQHVRAREHTLSSDEPEDIGGTNAGPTPFELLLASFGSCMSTTMLLYARRKGWGIKTISVAVQHERVPIQVEAEGGIRVVHEDQITKSIAIDGELDELQRVKLLEIAAKCPIHRLLTGGVSILDDNFS